MQEFSQCDRRQWVCINLSYGNWASVTSGAPQGSALGPLPYLIYINDLDTNAGSKMSKFADETKLRHRAGNLDDITDLQEDINKLAEWASKCQMNFNVDKCSVMHIGHNNNTTTQGNYNMSNQPLPTTDQQLDLGIISNKHLKCKNKERKAAKRQTESGGSLSAISCTKSQNWSFYYTNS